MNPKRAYKQLARGVKPMKKFTTIFLICLLALLIVSGTAMAAWPSGSQGDQYASVNNAMVAAASQAGISPDTFIAIYNSAISGNLSAFSSSQLDAACQVMSSLASYKSVLADYNTVYNNLGCSSRLAGWNEVSRGALPSTGIAISLLLASGVIGLIAASQLLRRSRRQN